MDYSAPEWPGDHQQYTHFNDSIGVIASNDTTKYLLEFPDLQYLQIR